MGLCLYKSSLQIILQFTIFYNGPLWAAFIPYHVIKAIAGLFYNITNVMTKINNQTSKYHVTIQIQINNSSLVRIIPSLPCQDLNLGPPGRKPLGD